MEKMIGQPAFTFSFKRKDKAKTLGDASAVKVAPEQIIDPALLFQWFLVVSKTGDLSLEDVMSFELSPFPPDLFEAKNVFRKADKPQLSHAIIDYSSKVSSEAIIDIAPKTECYVLDGGSLLHRLPWKLGDSYGAIAQSYIDFPIDTMDWQLWFLMGYGGGPSIKDNTHQRRGHNIHPVVKFTEETVFSGKKGDFLSRDSNKQGLINLISDGLRKRGCNVINGSGDADVDIVKAAVESSHLHSTTLIGEDTDLFVLLLYHAHAEYKNLYFRSDTKAKATKVYNINRLKVILGNDLCSQLLFIHAITGCDTTPGFLVLVRRQLSKSL